MYTYTQCTENPCAGSENVRHNVFYYIIQRAKYRVERVYKQKKNRKRTAIAAEAMLSLSR